MGSTNTTAKLFDMRKNPTGLYTFDRHKEAVSQVGWNPKEETILASGFRGEAFVIHQTSGKVCVIKSYLKRKLRRDHLSACLYMVVIRARYQTFREGWVVASVAGDNIVDIGQMSENIYLEQGESFVDKPNDDLPAADKPEDDSPAADNPTIGSS